MKCFKTFGLAVTAAIALMAVLGAGTASATALYKGETMLPAGTEISASQVGNSVFEETSGTVLDTCSGSTLKTKTENTGGSTETSKSTFAKENLTWSGCSTSTSTGEGGGIEVHWNISLEGSITVKSMKVNLLLLGSTCGYTAGSGVSLGTLLGKTKAGENAQIVVNSVLQGVTGNSVLCPADVKWVGEYKVESPAPLHPTAS